MISLAAESPLAAHFVGVVLATIFYGITLAQTFAYYRTYTTDPQHMKLIVALLLLLDTSQVVFTFASIYGYTIPSRGDENALQYVSRPFMASMATTTVVAFTVQMIYAYRVWRLSAGNACLTTSIVVLSFIALASSTTMTAKTIRNPRWDQTRVNDLPAAIILASTMACDLLIAVAQVWLFHRHRFKRGRLFCFAARRRGAGSVPQSPAAEEARGKMEPPTPVGRRSKRGSLISGIAGITGSWRVGSAPGSTVTGEAENKNEHVGDVPCDEEEDGCQYRRLGALLTTLTVLVINVGLLTSLDAMLYLVLFLACPSNGTFLVPYILLSNCYVNSFLSMYVKAYFIGLSANADHYLTAALCSLNSRRLLRDLVENPEHFPVTFDFALDTG
ncbi:hypothetical protein C8J57DRAFT_76145 [Mycena rebaudengoi]|nr:hypothetical protein C8J57DRAFT_76145 [Mycena rebaudengoi]